MWTLEKLTEAEKVYSKDVMALESRVSIIVSQQEHTTVDGSTEDAGPTR
jgi:hypothetical protein